MPLLGTGSFRGESRLCHGTSSKSTKLVHGDRHPTQPRPHPATILVERVCSLQNAPLSGFLVAFVLPLYEGDRHQGCRLTHQRVLGWGNCSILGFDTMGRLDANNAKKGTAI